MRIINEDSYLLSHRRADYEDKDLHGGAKTAGACWAPGKAVATWAVLVLALY
jgi:hypothetical protein